jgi:hypothetical protein
MGALRSTSLAVSLSSAAAAHSRHLMARWTSRACRPAKGLFVMPERASLETPPPGARAKRPGNPGRNYGEPHAELPAVREHALGPGNSAGEALSTAYTLQTGSGLSCSTYA